jgi:hypothetical protein
MHDHESLARGVVAFPVQDVSKITHDIKYPSSPTLDESWAEYMCRLADKITFLCNTNRSKRVIPCDHPTREMCRSQGLNRRRSSWLQFVFKDDQTQESKARLCLFAVPSFVNSRPLRVKNEKLTASSSAPSATTIRQCSSLQLQSRDIRVSCSMTAGPRSHPELVAASSASLLLYNKVAYMNPYRIYQP